MPPPSTTSHLPPTHPAARQRPKSPNRVLEEAEAQWLFTDAELANTPSIQDGMGVAEERDLRSKGINFIVQVGIMLKLPQLTLSTAAIFFNRFLMRASLKRERDGIPKLHHYQIAATAIFLATKVEESCRKLRDLILACCRVAQKNPNLVVDEQSKDWWRWRDCILHNEDVLLEVLCFDLTIESPHKQLFEMLKWFKVENHKGVRNKAWSFVTDSNNTPICLLCSSRTIAAAGLYAACRYTEVALPDDPKCRPWWEQQGVKLKDLVRVAEYMRQHYEDAASKTSNGSVKSSDGSGDGERSFYVGVQSPFEGLHEFERTRLRGDDQAAPLSPFEGSEHSSSLGVKREAPVNGVDKENKRPRLEAESNGVTKESASVLPDEVAHELKREEETARVEDGNARAEAAVEEGSEEGELEE